MRAIILDVPLSPQPALQWVSTGRTTGLTRTNRFFVTSKHFHVTPKRFELTRKRFEVT
jgi:hypothetical protein